MICQECKTQIIDNNDQFTCTECKRTSHTYCNLYTKIEIEKGGIKACDVCRIKVNSKIKCELCRKNYGMLKQFKYLSKLKWIHFTCSKWFPQIIMKTQNTYKIFICDDKLPSATWLSDCSLCHKTNNDFLVKCGEKQCDKYTHTKCAIGKKMVKKKDNYLLFFCENHINTEEEITKVVIDDSDPIANRNNIIMINAKPEKEENIKTESYLIKENKTLTPDLSISKTEPLAGTQSKPKKFHIGIINTIAKCDICYEKIKGDEIDVDAEIPKVKHCKKCFCWVHISCETNFYNVKLDSDNYCYKCGDSKNEREKCFVCGYNFGSMAQCHQKWIHALCVKALSSSFYVHESNSKSKNKVIQFRFDNYHHNSNQVRKCDICSSKNTFTLSCSTCGVTFHPYCAFMANFDIKNKDGTIIIKCDKNHKIFLDIKKEVSNNRKDHSTPVVHINLKPRLKKKKKLFIKPKSFKRTITKLLNVPSETKTDYVKLIDSINFSFLKEKLIYSGKINPLQMTKMTHGDRQKFDWNTTSPYFIQFEQEDIGKIFNNFPFNYKNEEFLSTYSPNSNTVNIDEEGDKSNSDYILVNFNVKDKNQFVLYNKTKLEKEKMKHSSLIDSLCATEPTFQLSVHPTNNNFKLISKKRSNHPLSLSVSTPNKDSPISTMVKTESSQKSDAGLQSTSHSSQMIYKKLTFLRSFKLNSLSQKMLDLESKATENLPKDIKYIDAQIEAKLRMLKMITNTTKPLIEKIVLNYSNNPLNEDLSKKQNINNKLTSSYKSNMNFQIICARMKHSETVHEYTDLTLSKTKSGNSLKEIAYEQFANDSECCVCFDINNENDYASTQILFCDKCNVSFHQTCYGVQSIPEGDYICDLCKKTGSKAQFIHCELCGSKGGAMKQIGNEMQFAHVTCVLFSKKFFFRNFFLMNEIGKAEDEKSVISDKELPCEICKNSLGETEKCQCCGKNYHFFCIYFFGGKIKYDYEYSPYTSNNKKMIYKIIQCQNENQEKLSDIRKLIYQKCNNN